MTVHEVTSSTIKVSWLEPEKPNGPNLIYRIYYTSLNQTHLAMPKNDPENGMRSEAGIHYYTLKKLRKSVDACEMFLPSRRPICPQAHSPNTKLSSSLSQRNTMEMRQRRSSKELMSQLHRNPPSRISLVRRTERFCWGGSVHWFTTTPSTSTLSATNHRSGTFIDNFRSTPRLTTLRQRFVWLTQVTSSIID